VTLKAPNVRGLRVARAIVLMTCLPCAAHAELSCHEYLRGAQLGDPDIIAQAIKIAQPWFQIEWYSVAKNHDAAQSVPDNYIWMNLKLRQLVGDCQVLPDDTVDAIVATRMKGAQAELTAAQAQQAAEKAAHEAARREQEEYKASVMVHAKAEQDAKDRAPPLPNHIAPLGAVVGRITCGQYLKYATGKLDSEVERAFTTVLQRAVDADPLARTAHIHYDGGRQYDGAASYCVDHLDGTLADSLREYIANARTWASPAADKMKQEGADASSARPGEEDTLARLRREITGTSGGLRSPE
jgi:hypothetical protein